MILDNVPYTNLHELNLDWILRTMKRLDVSFEELKKQVNDLDSTLSEQIKELQDWINSFDNSYIEEVISRYIQTAIFFGLTDDGYWIAYIPETWDEIEFNTTGLDIFLPIAPDYGHLVLSY